VKELAATGPLKRALYLVQFRHQWAQEALKQEWLRKDWLKTYGQRLKMTIWEGFGRYSPLGPRDIRTHQPRPERESFREYRRYVCLIWLPVCLFGAWHAFKVGWDHLKGGLSPDAWILLVYAGIVTATVVLLIPLNWDRYYLPIQPAACLLGGYAVLGALKWLGRRLILPPVDRHCAVESTG